MSVSELMVPVAPKVAKTSGLRLLCKPVELPVPELGGHEVHATAEAAVTLNVPAPQAARVLPAPVNPASATQSVRASEPVKPAVVESLGQPLQAAEDAPAALKVPCAHAATALPTPVNPGSARHADSALDPVLDPVPVFAGQAVHGLDERLEPL